MLLLRRFGYLYEEFRSYEQSLITQFALLVGDSSPDYSDNKLMCLYVVGLCVDLLPWPPDDDD